MKHILLLLTLLAAIAGKNAKIEIAEQQKDMLNDSVALVEYFDKNIRYRLINDLFRHNNVVYKIKTDAAGCLDILRTIQCEEFSFYFDAEADRMICSIPQGWEKDSTCIIPANLKPEEDSKIYRVAETIPEFPGGDAEMSKFLANNLKYPPAMVEMVISGRVIAGFVVEKDGSINSVEIVRSLHPLFDAEVMRVIRQMPKWIPGQLNGKPVRMYYLMPVKIDLQ